jgi:hypothetical protein
VSIEGFESYIDTDTLQAGWAAGGGAWTELSLNERFKGDKSMELQYFNRQGNSYSQAVGVFDSPQNWNVYDGMGFHFKGVSSNQADKLYMTLEDAGGGSSTVFYEGSPDDLKNSAWQNWIVTADQLMGVDTASIKSLAIGVGDPGGSASSASGILYIDDIGPCGGGGAVGCPCLGDLSGDGQIDLEDLQAVAGVLLEAGSPFVVAVGEGDCGDLNTDLQLDLEDLQAVAGILLDAGSPFVAPCE